MVSISQLDWLTEIASITTNRGRTNMAASDFSLEWKSLALYTRHSPEEAQQKNCGNNNYNLLVAYKQVTNWFQKGYLFHGKNYRRAIYLV